MFMQDRRGRMLLDHLDPVGCGKACRCVTLHAHRLFRKEGWGGGAWHAATVLCPKPQARLLKNSRHCISSVRYSLSVRSCGLDPPTVGVVRHLCCILCCVDSEAHVVIALL